MPVLDLFTQSLVLCVYHDLYDLNAKVAVQFLYRVFNVEILSKNLQKNVKFRKKIFKRQCFKTFYLWNSMF
jgi:hypothetical protein